MTGGRAEPDYLRRRRRRRVLAGAALAAIVLVVAVTARRPDLDRPCEPPAAAPAGETALLPGGLTLETVGTVTDVRREPPHILVEAVTAKPPHEAAILLQDAVVAAGYRFAGADSEGFEAEVFFELDGYAGGQAAVEPSPCAGRWNVSLSLLDPDAVPPR